MATKQSKGQQELFDGFAVSVYDGKFAGGFDIDESLARDIGFDDVVTFVVTGRIGAVAIGETKVGDMKRTNTFQVVSSVALDPALAEKLLNSIGAQVNGINMGQTQLDGTVSGPGLPDEDLMPDVVATEPVRDPVLSRFLEGHGNDS